MPGLTKLEILLACSTLCGLIGTCWFAFLVPDTCPAMLKDVAQQCNYIHEARLVNYCYQRYDSMSDWTILDQINSSAINKTLKEHNLTIETGWDRLNKRLNIKGAGMFNQTQ